MSTAVAVFCHELPHELGDFAVLLKAGMSARQAVYYNILSSILSFFGMCVGILIGDTPEASQWIFAVAAGLFLYIALVDMVNTADDLLKWTTLTSFRLLDAGTDLVARKRGRFYVLTNTAAVPRHDLWLLDDAAHRPLRARSQRNIRRLGHFYLPLGFSFFKKHRPRGGQNNEPCFPSTNEARSEETFIFLKISWGAILETFKFLRNF